MLKMTRPILGNNANNAKKMLKLNVDILILYSCWWRNKGEKIKFGFCVYQ